MTEAVANHIGVSIVPGQTATRPRLNAPIVEKRLGVHHAVSLPRCPVGNYTTRQQEEGEVAVRPAQVSQR
jgi:hypothetical protein